MAEQEEVELIKLLKEQNGLLRQQQTLLKKSIAEIKANTDMLLDNLESHILKNRKYLIHADECLQGIARIRNESESPLLESSKSGATSQSGLNILHTEK